MPIERPLPEVSLHDICAEIATRKLRDSEILRGQMQRDFGIPIICVAERPDFGAHAHRGEAFAASSIASAVPSNFGHVLLRNPVGSGIMVLLRRAYVECDTAAQFLFGTTAQSTGTGRARNLRLAARRSSAIINGNISATSVLEQLVFSRVGRAANAPAEWFLPLVIEPGDGIVIEVQTVNLEIRVGYEWVEVPM